MGCKICGETRKKMIKCTILDDICMRCCFAISSGSPKLLDTLKKEYHLSKTDILRVCSECRNEL
ncbi:MAG: hypothetical protein ABII23_01755 [bacterium]